MKIAEFSVNNRVLVNLLMAVLFIGGIVGYNVMVREVFPVVPLDIVAVATSYPGVAPEEIEKNITIPIEKALKGVSGVEHINSRSLEGLSMIEVELEENQDLKTVAQDIRSAIERVEDLPEEAEEPLVIEIESEIPVIMVNISGGVAEERLREVADFLESRISLIDGVASVNMIGFRDREIHIEVDPQRMYALGIGINEVIDAVARRNLSVAAGVLKGRKEEVLLRTTGEFRDIKDAENTVVRINPKGRHIYLKEIGRSFLTFEDAEDLGRVNGKPSLSLEVTKKKKGDAIQIVEEVRDIISHLQKSLPEDIHITYTQDSSMWIKSRLRTLYVNGAIGFFLVCLTLFLFLNWRIAIWTALGIPTSFLGAFLIMAFLDKSINMLSLFALIVVLGLVVDDAIIVSENVYRYIQMGYSTRDAAIKGTQQVFLPVIATVATTIAAFVPMLMMTGIMGKFIKIIPLVVSLVLIVSLAEALIVLPSHLADFAQQKKGTDLFFRKNKSVPFTVLLRRIYQKILIFALRRRYLAIMGVITVTAMLAGYAYYMQKFVLFSIKDIPGFVVMVEAPVGARLEETSRLVGVIEQKAETLPKSDVNAIVSMIGKQIDFETGRPTTGSNLGLVYVELANFDAPDRRNGYEVIREMREKLKGLTGFESLKVEKLQGGPPLGPPVELKIRGDDIGTIRKISMEVEDFLSTIPGVKDIRDDYSVGKKEFRFQIDPARAALYGISTAEVARAVRASFHGETVSKIRWDDESIDVVVRFAEPYRGDYRYLERLRIRNHRGELVPLKNVIRPAIYEGINNINHKDLHRAITVSADVDTRLVTSGEVTGKIKERFSNIGVQYPGYDIVFGGETEEQKKSVASLARASLLALLIIYTILGGLFRSFLQPLLVMFTLPFGFIGVVIGHIVMGQDISLLSLIGLTALAGVVVNNSLILVDFVNHARRRGIGRWISIVYSCRVRMRPILLTTITTVLGLVTLSFQTRGQAGYLAPMAISMVWGLSFATILTLIVIPSLLAITDDIIRGVKRVFRLNRSS